VDGGWGWIVVVGSAVCHFFLLGISRCIGLVFALLQERFEASATDAALAAAIFVSVRALGGDVCTSAVVSYCHIVSSVVCQLHEDIVTK